MNYDKLPPQAIDIEQVVLGSLILDADAYDKTIEFLKEQVFYKPAHQVVYRAIIGDVTFVVDLTSSVISTTNVQVHSAILYEKFLRRELIRISIEMGNAGYNEEEDVFDLVSKFHGVLYQLVHFN